MLPINTYFKNIIFHRYIIICYVLVLTTTDKASSQSLIKRFFSLSFPEKRWVICHPFIAKKAFKIGEEARKVSENMKNDRELDGDANGGQIDAFRHAFWMARLSQEIKWKKAYRLGIAHEKGNYRDFKKHRLEEGTLPDSASCEMDLRNNNKGIDIGKANPHADIEFLSNTIKKEILKGNLWIIYKDKRGNFLNCNGEIIPGSEIKGQWSNPKCLVPSNTPRP
ncbi:MAG: hypothetical protein Kow0068_19720 [Marinilabiliales bacterium]